MLFAKNVNKVAALTVAAALIMAAAPYRSRAATPPAVTVSDQVVTDHYVVIDKVQAAQVGWIVIHAGDKAGTVLGYTAVNAGENDHVEVQIDLSKATPTVSAMLHIDAGVIGTYEFPGADVPVKAADGHVINVTFNIIGVDVDDQFVTTTQAVKINAIVAQQDGWIVIHASDTNGTVLGYAPISAGLTSNLSVPLDQGVPAAKITEKLTAMIHIDAGVIGKYEFPGYDAPAALGGTIANEPFWTVDHVRVVDQKLAADGTFTIPGVLAAVDGWIVIHSSAPGAPVIGHAPIKAGLNKNVKVKIDDPKTITDRVSAMLHIDAGVIGTYEFPGPDSPVLGANGKPIAPLFATTGEAPNATPTATLNAQSAATPAATKAATPAATKAATPAATPAATKSR